jgi:NAD(P)H-dependent FMN reductase
MLRIAIVVGSTRPGRQCDTVARWVHDAARGRTGDVGSVEYAVLDLADFELALLDEPVPAALSSAYAHERTRRWSRAVDRVDGYVFVTPEYNHGTTAALKNALDLLYVEWGDKAAGFVSYGLQGGVRAVEHLRLVVAELAVADVRAQVALSLFTDFTDGQLRPDAHQEQSLHRMLDQLTSWATALQTVRAAARDRTPAATGG